MKNEPLKGKAQECLVEFDGELIRNREFRFQDVKSAVEGLLEEISKLDRIELEEFSDEQFDNLHDPDEVIVHAVDYFKHLVKKWFADVFEND